MHSSHVFVSDELFTCVHQVIAYDQGQVIESPSFTSRVEFVDMPWSADIILNDTRVSDAGIYRCVVSNPPETGDPGIGELSLRVLGKNHLILSSYEGGTKSETKLLYVVMCLCMLLLEH